MFVEKLDHVNIRVKDPEATIAFLMDLLEMGRHDTVEHWLLDGDGHPAIHVGNVDWEYPSDGFHPFDGERNGGPVHHVALVCTGFDAMRARLEARGLKYRCNDRPGRSFRQLFVAEPGGLLLELNFRGD